MQTKNNKKIVKKIVFCGGGTAGHVMPNMALLPHLNNEGYQVHYIGSNGIEKTICSAHKNIIFHEIKAEKLRRNLSPKNLLIPFKVWRGYRQSKKILQHIKPAVLFSKGGFAALPPVFAAHRLKIPVLSHESDLTLGLANRLIYKKCKKMFCSFEATTAYGSKCVHSGSIIRDQIFTGSKTACNLMLDSTKKTVLIMGGSLGAAKINEAVFAAAPQLAKIFNIIHICGKGKTRSSIKISNYHQLEFTSHIEHLFAAADFVVGRAGSGSIFEFLALKKPMLLIPLASGRGDQILNAKNFKEHGLANVLPEEQLTPQRLIKEIERLQTFKFPVNILNKTGNAIILHEIKSY